MLSPVFGPLKIRLTFTLGSLTEEAIQERPTVITKSRALVIVNHEPVGHIHTKPDGRRLLWCSVLYSWAFSDHKLVAPFVHDTCAD